MDITSQNHLEKESILAPAKSMAPDFRADQIDADLIEANARKIMAVYLLLEEYIQKMENGETLSKEDNGCFSILSKSAAAFTEWLVSIVGADRCNDLVLKSPRCKEIEELFYDLGITATTYQSRILKCAKKRLQK